MENTIYSKVIGQLTHDKSFDDWWNSTNVTISFFDNKPLQIIYMDYTPASDPGFLAEADIALEKFLQLGNKERERISDLIYKNCTEFLENIGYNEEDDALWKLKEPIEIWKFVDPQEIYVTRGHDNDKDIYLTIACECEWEQEHGLQLVFREGNKLVRVSEQDGHLTETDAYNNPDEDEVLIEF